MKRAEKEVKELAAIEAIIDKADVCRLAMSLDNKPYVVPMNFGYKDNCLYFHCANKGHKLEILKQNPDVCFEMDVNHKLVTGDIACKYTMTFESVIGFGKAFIITDNDEKKICLDIVMGQYAKDKSFEYTEKALNAVTVIKLEIASMTGKSSYLKA